MDYIRRLLKREKYYMIHSIETNPNFSQNKEIEKYIKQLDEATLILFGEL